MLVSLQVGKAVEAGADSVSIDMLYDAFDLKANFPLFPPPPATSPSAGPWAG